jgi:hypothetical protein
MNNLFYKAYLFNYEKNKGKIYQYVRNKRRALALAEDEDEAESDSDTENEKPRRKKARLNNKGKTLPETTHTAQFDVHEMERIKELLKHLPANHEFYDIKEKFKLTHHYRKKWILEQSPSLTQILEEYPILNQHSSLVILNTNMIFDFLMLNFTFPL